MLRPERYKTLEKKAIEKILSELPPPLDREYSALMEDFHNQLSEEARFLKELDKLEMALQALEFKRRGYRYSMLSSFLTTANDKIHDLCLRDYLSTILDEVKRIRDSQSNGVP
jgi:putative hydrolase of HD superfamily